ncbi:hypothetical protein BMWSH_2312 [Priestia megaterium WSH-002]|uniref:Uncharacterized protein n=1 Tax=Priestia megaterium (strain WSH-002) TaxID=1006007 RepID=A0A8D3WYH3_PRIMW|nr:hypothetical protein BMWSH_2312 [Priestia megaterium WSH-002]
MKYIFSSILLIILLINLLLLVVLYMALLYVISETVFAITKREESIY